MQAIGERRRTPSPTRHEFLPSLAPGATIKLRFMEIRKAGHKPLYGEANLSLARLCLEMLVRTEWLKPQVSAISR